MKRTLKLAAMPALAAAVAIVAACQTTGVPLVSERTITPGKTGNTVNPGKTGADANTGSVIIRSQGDATITGKVLDEAGRPVVGARVVAGDSSTLTGADGSYTLKVSSGDNVNVKIIRDGYIIRDSSFPVPANGTMEVTSSIVKADDKVTQISAAKGGTAVSSDGQVQLVLAAGSLSKDTSVRVTWLNPVENASKPAAFRIAAVADAGPEGGKNDAVADDGSAPADAKNRDPVVNSLNTSQLPGPLETTAYGSRKYFSPVAFADVSLSAPLKAGESATLRMAVSKEVLDDMIRSGELKDSDLGQEMYPCFSWSADASTWDKPALSKIVKDEKGKYWYEYTVRPNNMSANGGTAKYQTLQVGDASGSAQVSLVVGGGRRVVDGTYTYGALIERSSDAAYDMHGLKNVTLVGGANWTNAGGHYRAPNRSNLIRPDVKTDSYTGTAYASAMGTEAFSKWDREGIFRLAFPPGEAFEINSPVVMGVRAGDRRGTTETAKNTYLTPDPSGQSSATQTQSIASTYAQPFYYRTDAAVTVKLKTNTPNVPLRDEPFVITYTYRGQAKTETVTPKSGTLRFENLPRNASGTSERFTITELKGADWSLKKDSKPGIGLEPGTDKVLDNVELQLNDGAK